MWSEESLDDHEQRQGTSERPVMPAAVAPSRGSAAARKLKPMIRNAAALPDETPSDQDPSAAAPRPYP